MEDYIMKRNSKENISNKIKIIFCSILLFTISFSYIYPFAVRAEGIINDNNPVNSNIGFWIKTSKMNNKYSGHLAVLLPNGNVLIRGDNTAEIFIPDKNMYKNIQVSDRQAASYANANIMRDNNLLIIYSSRMTGKSFDTLEVFDCEKETFIKFNGKFPYPFSNTDSILSANAYIISDKYILLSYHKKEQQKYYTEYYLYNYIDNTYSKIEYNNEYGRLDDCINRIDTKNQYFISLNSQNQNIQNNSFYTYNILRLDTENKKIKLIDEIKLNPGHKEVFVNGDIYFFYGKVIIDSREQRENIQLSPIYKYNIKQKKLEKIENLHNGGNVKTLLLNNGEILFNSGIFSHKGFIDYIQYEIFDTKINTSFFTEKRPYYKKMNMTLLNDGSVLFTGGYVLRQDWEYGSSDSYRYYINRNKK